MGCCQSSNIEPPLLRKSQFVKNRKATVQIYYEVIEVLGRGSYSTVSKVRDKRSGLLRAMKEVNKVIIPRANLENLENEVSLLRELDHPNIMKIFEIIESERHCNIFSEYLAGGEVFEAFAKHRSFTEKVARHYIFDLLSGLNYLHDNKIVHCDIKLENLMLESKGKDSRVKIIGFGASKKLAGPLDGRVGTV